MRAMVLSARHPTASHRLMTNVLQVALTCIVGQRLMSTLISAVTH